MNRKIVFLDLRKKINDEEVILSKVAGFDEVISLSPYSSYLLNKLSIEFLSFSDVEDDLSFHSKVIDKYKRIENHIQFCELENSRYILRDFAKYITYDQYLNVIKKKTENNESTYITDANENLSFCVNTSLAKFIKFDCTISLTQAEKIYRWNKIKVIIGKIRELKLNELIRRITIDKRYIYDNKFYIKKYKVKKVQLSSVVDIEKLRGLILEVSRDILTDDILGKELKQEVSILIDQKTVGSEYIPFMYLHNREMYLRYELYKKNSVPVIIMQHGSYVHENYFLRYNEILAADVNLVFNSFTKKLFEDRGANKVYNVGSLNYDKKIKAKRKIYDYVYITYCTQYGYSGFYIGSEKSVISPVGDNIYNRHKEVIESFGVLHPDKKLCIKVQPGVFLGDQLYIPLKELASKYSNVTVKFEESLFSIIEKSKYIISDYFSSEFSNKYVLKNRDAIVFGDVIKFDTPEIERDMKDLFMVVDDISQMNNVVSNIDHYVKEKEATKTNFLIEKYSFDSRDTKKMVNEIIDEYL